MNDESETTALLGLFWVVEDRGRAVLIAHTVPMEQVVHYGDMLTTDAGHFEFWAGLARRAAGALRAAGIPAAPVWSEYEEWPRGRVLYDDSAQCFVIRADLQLHQPGFLRLIAERFHLNLGDARVLADDHYRSVRRVPLPVPPADPV